MAKAQATQETVDNGEDLGMGFIDVNLTDVPELVLLDNGEHFLRVKSVKVKTSKGEKTEGQNMLFLVLESTEVPNASDIFHNIMLPHADVDEKGNIRRMNDLKEAADALGVPYDASGIRPSDFLGKEGWAVVSVEESPQYGKQNRIDGWVTGA